MLCIKDIAKSIEFGCISEPEKMTKSEPDSNLRLKERSPSTSDIRSRVNIKQ